MTQASLLAQQSQSLVGNAPSLVAADNPFSRQTVTLRIQDQTTGLNDLIRRMQETAGDPGVTAAIERMRTDLVENLNALDATVQTRMAQERQIDGLLHKVLALKKKIRDGVLTEHGVAPSPEHLRWLVAAQDAVAVMLVSLNTRNGICLRNIAQFNHGLTLHETYLAFPGAVGHRSGYA
ncbi:MAG: hypothetical protein HC888_14205 [Candidatus Competibacteraceae bacterium]|nr:hypothetical protein [Candidatus Competibacteraceae bacterium]